jgi:hypothetical protein
MLGKLLTPFTAPGAAGTTFRDLIVAVSAIVVMLGTLGVLKQEQVDALNNIISVVSQNWPALLLVGGTVLAAIMRFRAKYMSRTPEGEAVGKAVDKAVANDTLPANTPIGSVELQTPRGMDNITVPVAPVK